MRIKTRQSRFIDEYLIDLNGAKAAIRAGYSPSGARQEGSRLLANADIRKIVRKKQAEAAVKLEITRDDVIRVIVNAIELARDQDNPNAMIMGCREIAKMLGFYYGAESHVHFKPENTELLRQLEVLSDERLLEIVENDV